MTTVCVRKLFPIYSSPSLISAVQDDRIEQSLLFNAHRFVCLATCNSAKYTFEVFFHENTFELDYWITGSWSQDLGSESMAWLRTFPGMAGVGVFTP